jgi:hypothetical protein
MTRRRTTILTLGPLLCAALIADHLLDGHRSGHPVATVNHARPADTQADPRVIAALARRFVVTLTTTRSATRPVPPGQWATLVTTGLARQLTTHPPVTTIAQTSVTQWATVESVAVRPRPPVTALVTANLTDTTAGRPAVRAPMTVQLRFTRTPAGWRVGSVTA